METIELGAKKARVHALQRELAPSVEKKKVLDDFWAFIDKVRQPTANYKFIREESYV